MSRYKTLARKSQCWLWISWCLSRLLAVASLSLLSLFVIAHLWEALTRPETPTPTASEWLLLMLFPTGVLLGLGIGLRCPLCGGFLSIGSLIMFYLVHQLLFHRIPSGPYFAILASPGLLLFVDGLLHLIHRPPASTN